MIRNIVLALPLLLAGLGASAGTLSEVSCSEYSVSLTFASDIQDSGGDVTRAGVSSSASGPFRAFGSTSVINVEDNRNVTITLSETDSIYLGRTTGGSSCVIEVNSGFVSGVTSTSTLAE